MLVLTRKIGEVIRIGTDIDVVVVSIGRGRVRLGFDLPKEIPVRRNETLHAVEASHRQEAEDCASPFCH